MDTDRKVAISFPPAPPSAPSNGSNNAFPRVRPMHGRTSGPTRRSTKGQWTSEEDEILRKAVQSYKGKNWKKIAECFKERTDVQCLHRWQKVLNPELIKGPWSKEEDEIIVQLVNKYGPKKWSTISQHLPGRIGKQCRERWHNHLNPAINKEAWTQEEELLLIRAHQIHGNRWAELTKYLPGRTDNSIKNHWNSSVKKKLDSFIASGLLAQFQGLPPIESDQNQSGASLPVLCSNGDGSVSKGGADTEEISECSQVGCSQTASEISNTPCQTKEEFLLTEESNYGNVQATSPTLSYPEQYYTSLDDITFTIGDIPCEFRCSSKYLEENFSENPETGENRDYNFVPIDLQNIALELVANSSNHLSGIYVLADTNHDRVHCSSHPSTVYGASALVHDTALGSDYSGQELELNAEGCAGYPSSVNFTNSCDIIDMDRYSDALRFETSFQVSEVGANVALQPYNPMIATMGDGSQCQNLASFPFEISEANGVMICTNELNQINGNLSVSQAHEVVANAGLANMHDHSDSASHGNVDVSYPEQMDLMDSSKLIHVDAFGSETLDSQQTQTSQVKSEEPGTLCYEPPRFPSMDIPFLSCDLAQSATEGQQDFSPLGIRQLMMSSLNSLTPLKLWDSPSSDDSPDAVLKSAAKTFACTPSILKKRHRDLLSPLSPFSERRYGKKIGSDMNQGFLCTSRLTKEFSRLDVIVTDADEHKELPSNSHDQNGTTEASSEDKENICPASRNETEEANHSHDSGDKTSGVEANKHKTNKREDVFDHNPTIRVYEDFASETPRGILVECRLNATNLSSPDGSKPKAGSEISDDATEANQSSKTSSEKLAALSESRTSRDRPFVSPCYLGRNKEINDSVVSSSQSAPAMPSVIIDSLVNEIGTENLNIFGGTPFRRSIESPSAWKSPWFFSSLVPCSRFDTDIMFEDIGIFMSPGARSIDALGLMKQINEQNADAYADAKKVLGSDTPESIVRQRSFTNQDRKKQVKSVDSSQNEGRLHLASNVLTERRILDFSECESPAKAVEKMICGRDTTISSPSCLLKKYR